MNSNYIKNLVLSDNNNKLVIYFINNVYDCDKKDLTKINFRLHLLCYDLYKQIEVNDILKNDNDSYTLFFDIDYNFIDNNTVILVELVNVLDYNYNFLKSYQNNNSINIHYTKNYKPYNVNTNQVKKVSNNKQQKHFNYLSKSSPLLAYQNNLKIHHLKKINNYNEFYGKMKTKYPQSYYLTSYNKFFKPA